MNFMKMNKYSWLAALPMLFTACQEDALVKEQQQDKIYTLSAKMTGTPAMSRAQIQFDNEDAGKGEMFFWNEGDSFKLYQTINDNLQSCDFVISSDYKEPEKGSAGEAEFSSVTPAVASKDYIAIYPANVPVNETNDVQFSFPAELDFTHATTDEAKAEVWKEYFKNNMYMVARGQLVVDGANKVAFEHQCALARVTYTNMTGEVQEVGGIRLGGDQSFGSSYSFRLTGGSSGRGGTNSFELKTKGLSVVAGDSIDLYVLFFPRNFSDGEMHVTVMEKGHLALATSKIAEANNGASGFEAGKRYWFKVTQTKEGMKWTKDVTGDEGEGGEAPSEPEEPVLSNIEEVAKNGGTFTVNENTRLTSPLIVESDMTLKIEGGWLGGTSGNEFADPDSLKTLIAVKPGATLTLEGGNQLNTGHMKEQLSCVRMLGGSDAASKVVVNNGLIIGTYYAIVVDEDCQNAEVEINGGSLSCDWYKEFSGTAILNKGNAKVTVKGGTVSSYASAVEMWGGTFTMTGGTLQASFEGEKSHVNTNGVGDNCIVGSALGFYPAEGKKVTVSISGGTLQGLSSIYEVTGNVSLSVTGGTFEGAVISNYCKNFISGGQFTVQPNPAYIASGMMAESNGNHYEIKNEPVVTIENETLSTALKAHLKDIVTINGDGYAEIAQSIIEKIDYIRLENISDPLTLDGIEKFTALEQLLIANNTFKELEVSDLPSSVKMLNIEFNNSLTDLTFGSNQSIVHLGVLQNASLQKLDVSNVLKVKELNIGENAKLSEIILPDKNQIESLGAYQNALTSIDLSGCGDSLIGLGLGENQLKTLDVKNLKNLKNIDIPGNQLTHVDFSGCISLVDFHTEQNPIAYANLSGCTSLTRVFCNSGEQNGTLEVLNLSGCSGLTEVYCSGHRLRELDLSSSANLKHIQCGKQTDADKNPITIQVKLHSDLVSIWNNQWSKDVFNQPSQLITTGIEANDGNTGGNDFTIEGIY